MDIEDSEFALFQNPDCLNRGRNLSIDAHIRFSDPATEADTLRSRGFDVSLADENLRQLEKPGDSTFIYARRKA